MMIITYAAFFILLVICGIIQWIIFKSSKRPSVGNNPIFLRFQKKFFFVYLTATFADWLQGPYLYKLYSHYGFQEDQIAILYICGFLSSVLFGSFAPSAADLYGRKFLCQIFVVIYSISCYLKLSQNYFALALGRILGGIATSLLFSTFEAWYISGHIENDFPKEWISVTFSKASRWNGWIAICAGVVGNIASEWLSYGPVAPFLIAIPFLFIAGISMSMLWDENYSKHPTKFKDSCSTGFKVILGDFKIFLVGFIQSLFEAAIYIFIFLWTPVLDSAKPSLGITFSSFMVCILIGSSISQLLVSMRFSPINILICAVGTGLIGNLMCVYATNPDEMYRNTAFIAFLLIEISVGAYYNCMNIIQSKVIGENDKHSILNWFRIPLNLLAACILLALHNQTYRHGNRILFGSCSVIMSLSLLGCFTFSILVKEDENFSVHNLLDNGHALSIT